MNMEPTSIPGVFIITLNFHEDLRGSFTQTWCASSLAEMGCDTHLQQSAITQNKKAGTLRGLHYQTTPFEETKIVRCIRGAIYDVVVDIRENSPTFGHWLSCQLRENENMMLYIPPGVAHGYQTLENDSTLLYYLSAAYSETHARTIAYNDPTLNIKWPLKVTAISDRDREVARDNP